MNLDDVLASKVRRKIIRVLWKVGSTNIMDLVRKTNSTYNQIIPHLVALEKEGVVSEQRVGRVRMIALQRDSEKAKILLGALRILDKDLMPAKSGCSGQEAKSVSLGPETVTADSDVVSPLCQLKPKTSPSKSEKHESQ